MKVLNIFYKAKIIHIYAMFFKENFQDTNMTLFHAQNDNTATVSSINKDCKYHSSITSK